MSEPLHELPRAWFSTRRGARIPVRNTHPRSSTWLAPTLIAFALVACQQHEPPHRKKAPSHEGVPVKAQAIVTVPPRTPQLATFPCVEQCHKDREPNAEKRELTAFHSLKQFEHGDTTFWCNFCHDLDNLDQLKLLDGRMATFDESARLCGQCHGDKRRDWEAGIHGLQTGSWQSAHVRRACTACHDPHAPKRPTFEALPPPQLRGGLGEKHD